MSKTDHDEKFEHDTHVTTEIEFEDIQQVEDVSALRRVAEGIPTAAWFILVNEFWYAYIK